MPLLVALDECNCTLTKIENLAKIGIANPTIREAALNLILAECTKVDETIGNLIAQESDYCKSNPRHHYP